MGAAASASPSPPQVAKFRHAAAVAGGVVRQLQVTRETSGQPRPSDVHTLEFDASPKSGSPTPNSTVCSPKFVTAPANVAKPVFDEDEDDDEIKVSYLAVPRWWCCILLICPMC